MGRPTTVINTSYGRKPYNSGEEGDYLEMANVITRRAMEHQLESPRSQLDKPYLYDDYPDMEYEFPKPPGISIPTPLPDIPGITPQPDIDDIPGVDLPCSMVVLSPFKCCCDEDPELENEDMRWECVARLGFMQIPMSYHPPIGASGDDIMEQWCTAVTVLHNGSKAVTKYVAGGPHPLWIYPNEDVDGLNKWHYGDTLYAFVYSTDSNGVPVLVCSRAWVVHCFGCVENCCEDLPDGAFAYDTVNSPGTMDDDDSVTIYVTGGCAPFSWSVAGDGLSFAEATTTARENTLTSLADT